ncbi:MAG: hypothetical protein JXR77_02105 [Lentisphaeria bacterium]|nr:hypothetical protein [Lentisphaeria bacterium]
MGGFRRMGAVLLLGIGAWTWAGQTRHDRVLAVPAPAGVVLDGDLADWDLTGAVDTAFDDAVRPRFALRLAFMFDDEAFYVGADVADESPLLNRHDPRVEPTRGWAGDCLQVRLCSDPDAPYPLPDSNSDRICHVTLWYFTDRREPVCQLQYGMDYHGLEVFTGTESGVAFRPWPDGKGYVLEARLPWTRLRAAGKPPGPGEALALVVQPLWGDASGTKHVCTFNDIIRGVGFSFQGCAMWGQAILSPRGNLPAAAKVRSTAEQAAPLRVEIPLPDLDAVVLSAAILDEAGSLVRSLPVITPLPDTARNGNLPALPWNGLDDDGHPLPPGAYTVAALTHRGIGQRCVTSLHNAGTPPWRTDDGTGSWGGDHGPPVAAAADRNRIYLGWTISEAGWAVLALDQDPAAAGRARKRWGQRQLHDLGILVTALATDGQRVFVAQDGKRWGEKEAKTHTAGVVMWEAETGKPLNFPFGKRALVVSTWDAALKPPDKALFEAIAEGIAGPRSTGLNLLGLAVDGDLLYASLCLENRIVIYDWRRGEKVGDIVVPRPVGLALAADGRLLAVSGRTVVAVDREARTALPLVREGLSAPWQIAVGTDGLLYVSDCGAAMQVKVFAPDGRPLRTIGRDGGRPWIGRYDPTGMLMPAGLALGRDGSLWVAEHDDTPRRTSVWSGDGRLLHDLLGPGAYAVEGLADPRRPAWVNVHNTLFEVDYAGGAARTLATLLRPNLRGPQIDLDGGFMGRALKLRHVHGRSYAVHTGRGAVIVYRLREDLTTDPLVAMGDCGHLTFHLPEQVRSRLTYSHDHTFYWEDTNRDTFFNLDEIEITPVRTVLREYWGPWVDEDLGFWCMRGSEIHHTPVTAWRDDGMPVYPRPGEERALFRARGDQVHYVMPAADSLFAIEQQGGNAQTGKGAEWAAVSRYSLTGQRRWAYRRVWPGFGLEAPLSKPGDVVGAMKFIGHLTVGDQLLIGVNGYFGQFNLISGDGLWVASLCKDTRYGPPADATTVWPENFSGQIFRNREDGKAYLIAGDTDARIWEITGLETIRSARATLRISPEDHERALEAALRQQGADPHVPPLRLLRQPDIEPDGNLAEWDLNAATTLDAGPGRQARIALAQDGKCLFLACQVDDPSPMRNGGSDPALAFKTGDVCDLMLATDPTADRTRSEAVRGDIRLAFTVLEERPVCILYEPVLRTGQRQARLLSSPTGVVSFDRIAILDEARVTVQRSASAYVLEAAVPLAAIGLAPRAGDLLRGDVGVVFSDPGGNRNVLRLYHANRETAIVNDIPSEARLTPQHWGVIRVE